MAKKSPITTHASQATAAHRNEIDFYLTNDQVEASLVDALEIKKDAIPTKSFGEDELTRYVFGETAQEYGKFLQEQGITEMRIWLADMPIYGQLYAREILCTKTVVQES